jgi:hypothetical protein
MKKIREIHLWLALIMLNIFLVLFYYFSNLNLGPQEIILNWIIVLSPVFLVVLFKTAFHIKDYLKCENLPEDSSIGVGLVTGIALGLILSLILTLLFIWLLKTPIIKSMLIALSISYVIGFLIKTSMSSEISSIMHSALSPAIILGGSLALVDLEYGVLSGLLILSLNALFITIKRLNNKESERLKYNKF